MLKVRFLVRWGQLASGEGLADKCSRRVNVVGKGFARSMAAAECLARQRKGSIKAKALK